MGHHAESCRNQCKYLWWDEPDIGEVTNLSNYTGFVCDGHKNEGIVNLKNFPFKTKQKCYGKRR